MTNETQVPPVVIYHAGCPDGFCCAWLFHQVYPDAEFVAANYGDAPPNVAGRDVFIADFSYKRPVMLDVLRVAASVTVLDHHKTAEQELDGLAGECRSSNLLIPNVIFDMGKCGAHLVWEYLYGAVPTSTLVQYVEDRDLWKWALPDSREISAAIRSRPFTFAAWDELQEIIADDYHTGLAFLVDEGRAILRRERQIIDQHVGFARPQVIAGHEVPTVNATVLASEIVGELAKGKPFAAGFFIRSDGQCVYSLRSDPNGLDVSEIAKRYGGGGHKHAAGFTMPLLANVA